MLRQTNIKMIIIMTGVIIFFETASEEFEALVGQPANAGRRLLTATWHECWGVYVRLRCARINKFLEAGAG